jgi:hypothetical protein
MYACMTDTSRDTDPLFPDGIPQHASPISVELPQILRAGNPTLLMMNLIYFMLEVEHVQCVRSKPLAFYAWEMKTKPRKVLDALDRLEALNLLRRLPETRPEISATSYPVMLNPGIFPCLTVGEQRAAMRKWEKLAPGQASQASQASQPNEVA